MAEEAAPNPRAGRAETLPVAKRSFVVRARSEAEIDGKWPRAWRLLFLVGCAVGVWILALTFIRAF